MQELQLEQRGVLGEGLLPPFPAGARNEALVALNAAYGSVKDSRKENWVLWQVAREFVARTIRNWYVRQQGLEAPPWSLASLWDRVDLPHPSPDPLAHVRFVRAMTTSFQAQFSEQFEYRWRRQGNVHLAWRGGTGSGKSSAAVATADWFKRIEPGQLVGRLAYDLTEMPAKLKALERGDTIILDENIRLAGEGANTARMLLENLEDTLRGTQRNLFTVTPGVQEHAVMHAEMEAILWHPDKQFTLFLIWLDGVPHGTVAVPWMRKELYEVYKPWKDANLEKSVAGAFRDNSFLTRMAVRLFENPRFVRYMMNMVNKPKKADFKEAVSLYAPQMMAGSQAEALVNHAFNLCKSFARTEKTFEEDFLVEPNDGLRRVALKWYKE